MSAQRKLLWCSLVGLSIGATMLHLRIHPPSKGVAYLCANLFCWLDLALVSILFLSRKMAVWGLLLNSFAAFIGIILMADFSISATLAGTTKVQPGQDPFAWLLQTTLPDIAILFGDYMAGMALYRAILGGAQENP